MTRLSITRSSFEGFELVQINTGVLSLSLLPELGGKLNSLRDLRTGREWLWKNPRVAYQRAPHGTSYILGADTGGWDECFPTVAPCEYPSPPWAGTHIQDHGELWSQLAMLEVVWGDKEVGLYTRWEGVVLPYTFERTIKLAADSATLRFEYAVSNHADAPLQFIWSAHPLLALEPGMSLLLPPSASFNRWSSVPSDLFAADSGLRFPPGPNSQGDPQELGRGVRPGGLDLSNLPDTSARIALKLWSDPLDEGWAALRARDGELRMRWDVALLPQVGFWINLGAWAGDGGAPYYNLGLEPCMGAQDSLAEAVQRNLCATLLPRGLRTWWLELTLACD